MKRCPLCGCTGAIWHSTKGLPFVVCTAERCGAASKPAPTEAGALTNWATLVRAAESIPNDWMLYPPELSQAA